MIALLQRVRSARVEVGGEPIAAIDAGTLAFAGFHAADRLGDCARMAQRITGLRMFEDDDGRMNLDLEQAAGALLLVPQFTLAADTGSGRRPGFHTAAPAEDARALFEELDRQCRMLCSRVETGSFRAHMRVHLVNDGPVTFLLHGRDGTE